MIRIDVRKRLGNFRMDARFATPAESRLTALFGRSGCGKTSLIDMIAGLTRPDAGRIEVDGTVLFDAGKGINLPPERRRLGYVFQEGRLFAHLSVRQNLLYGMKRTGAGAVSLDQAVELLGLAELMARRPARLSGGERQRVAIGRALLANPRLLLMDEPLAALDAARKAAILPFIERLRDAAGLPVIYVSHAMEEVIRLAGHMVLMDRGRVVTAGTVEEVTGRPDLHPLTGRQEAGAVFRARVHSHDAQDDLTALDCAGGRLMVPRLELAPGAELRVRIRARDVMLALKKPEAISGLNIFNGRVRETVSAEGPFVDVMMDAGVALWARITRRSCAALQLVPGSTVFAIVKTVSIDRTGHGHHAQYGPDDGGGTEGTRAG